MRTALPVSQKAANIIQRDFDGKTAYRVIYRPNMIHPLVAFSTTCVGYAVDFFDTTLGAPKPLLPAIRSGPLKRCSTASA